MTKITEENLLKRGYKKFPPSVVAYPYSTALYQKCFKDDKGKRYYIDVCSYAFESQPTGYQAYATLYKMNGDENEADFEIEYYTNDIDEIEAKTKALWKWNGGTYYEEYTNE